MDHVLIKPNSKATNGAKRYHKPDPENPDQTRCSRHRVVDNWARKDPDLLPNHEPCKDCYGKINRSHTGTEPHTLLTEMDPEDLSA